MTETRESQVRSMIEGLFPDRSKRLMALEVLADCIFEANCFGRANWWVELQEGSLQLLVKGIPICRLGEGDVGLALDKGLWEKSRQGELQLDMWTWDETTMPEHTSIDARYGSYIPDENQHDEFWSWGRMLSAGAIFAASQSSNMEKADGSRHSHSALRYLRNEINHHVPDPLID